MKMNHVVFYGLGGIDHQYRVMRYQLVNLFNEERIIDRLRCEAQMIRDNYPAIETVYVVENGYCIAKSYREARNSETLEGWICFRSELETYGFLIPTEP